MDRKIYEELQGHVQFLADPRLDGRAPLTEGSREAREYIIKAFEEAGYRPVEYDIITGGKKHGTNVIAELPGSKNGGDGHFVLLGAHYDHFSGVPGADDNAAAVAEMLVLARLMAEKEPSRKNILFAAFDCEEPPHFHARSMGSLHYLANHAPDPSLIDLAIILDLTGHKPRVPGGLDDAVFMTGAEGSRALHGLVASCQDGVRPACIRNSFVGDMSDHHAFRKAKLPYLFLSAGTWQHYHQSSDTIEHLDLEYMVKIVQFVEELLAVICKSSPDAFKHDPFEPGEFEKLEAGLLSEALGTVVAPRDVSKIIFTLRNAMF